jgi:spore maturation protein CgeB
MKILFIGVFDPEGKSTNVSQLVAFNKLGHNVVGYNYRKKAALIGDENRDKDLISVIKNRNFDLVVYSKCNVISQETFSEINKYTKTCLWFMDPLISYTSEMQEKTSLVDFACFDKKNVLEKAKKFNNKCFYACEGFDSLTDKPYKEINKKYDIGFIGNLYGDRLERIRKINKPVKCAYMKKEVKVFSNAFGSEHPKCVSQIKINLNFCTSAGASDRVYKILGAKGFLLSDDWVGRDEHFEDGKDLIIYKGVQDLNDKIDYYLKHERERNLIASRGHETVQKFNRLNWAKRIVEFYEEEINV